MGAALAGNVHELIRDRLERSELDDLARAAVHAALAGDEELEAALRRLPDEEAAEPTAVAESTLFEDHVWLSGIRVAGFRGVAGKVELPLEPGPGLVLVLGRNGSGKSSIAEAAELALSGRSERTKYTVWQDGLLNLHRVGMTEVEIVLRQGAAQLQLGCRLHDDAVASAEQWTMRSGSEVLREELGWNDAVERYRPILTYGELSTLATTRPSELYDPVNRILGLESLTDADKRLASVVTARKKVHKAAVAALKQVLQKLATSEDERAAALSIALSKSTPDTSAAKKMLAGGGPPDSVRETLHNWAKLTGPDPTAVDEAVQALSQAIDRRVASVTSAAARAKQLANLLDLVLAYRQRDDEVCPVCGEGLLDAEWQARAVEASRAQRTAAVEAEAADRAVATAQARVRTVLPPVPSDLLGRTVTSGVDPEPARVAWSLAADLAARAGGGDDSRVIHQLVGVAEAAAAAVEALATSAAATAATHDEAWEPLAASVRDMLLLLDDEGAAERPLLAASAARKWLQSVAEEVRSERLTPFAAQISSVWTDLRQESNVNLAGVHLSGTTTRRQVRLDLQVDGAPGPRSVLSQGELAAIGLAVFLPRSAAVESPFRFVIIDDPVQSLDPSKVEGLACVLHRLAVDRQVVVFTHDVRLMHSLNRLSLPFTALQVERGERSVVTVEPIRDPVDQHLVDADALLRDNALPTDLVILAVAGYCRDAVNEAAIALARRRLLREGGKVEEIEAAVLKANSGTRKLLALALLADAGRTGSPLNRALDALDPKAAETVRLCVEGVHEPDDGTAGALLAGTRATVGALRQLP